MDGWNRRQFPFANLSNSALRQNAPSRLQPAPNVRITEELLEADDILHPGNSNYTISFLYRFESAADIYESIVPLTRMINERMRRTLQARNGQYIASSGSRLRFTYYNRMNIIAPSRRTTGRLSDDPDEVYDNLLESINFLLESNDELELEELYIVLDLIVNTARAGGTGTDEALGVENEGVLFDHVLQVSQRLHGLCGWVCVAMFMAQHYDQFSQLIGQEFWNFFPKPQNSRSRKSFYLDELTKSTELQMLCGDFLRKMFDCDRMFDLCEYPKLIVQKFPKMKIVIFKGPSKIFKIEKGTDWTIQTGDKWNLYMQYQIQGHLNFIPHFNRYIIAANAKSNKHYTSCYGCDKVITQKSKNTHKCVELKCDKCFTYFKSYNEYKLHKNPDVVPKYSDALDNVEIGVETFCENCRTNCYSTVCFEIHRINCNSYTKRTECPHCQKYFVNIHSHNCQTFEITCKNCKEVYARDENHRCYVMQSEVPEEWSVEEEGQKIYAFDFESMFVDDQITYVNGEERVSYLHEVNFIHIRQCFTQNSWSFNTLDEFSEWLLNKSLNEKMTLVAHNFKGYDGRLFYDHLIVNLKIIPTSTFKKLLN
jgi:hypothetical protein